MMQRFALATPFYSINVAGSFKSTVSECEWPSVTCTDDIRVSSLQPDGNGGTIPREIGHPTALTYLDLSYNQLISTVSAELGLLTDLTYLQLDNNQLTGTFPSAMCQFSFDRISPDVD
jgi:Leucine-rich repeat (LRR) protein